MSKEPDPPDKGGGLLSAANILSQTFKVLDGIDDDMDHQEFDSSQNLMTLIVYGTVVLGALYRLEENDYTRIAYHVVQGLQGIIVAMMVTCNCQVLKLYSKSMKVSRRKIPQMYGVDKKALNKSTSMQLLTWEPPPDIV